jgi:hypothetical protein
MSIDTEKPFGKALEWYVNLFSNRWNRFCDICWFLFGCMCHGLLGFGLGFALCYYWLN